MCVDTYIFLIGCLLHENHGLVQGDGVCQSIPNHSYQLLIISEIERTDEDGMQGGRQKGWQGGREGEREGEREGKGRVLK